MSQVIAKVFMSGRSQAVRLPKAFRFATDEVYVSRKAGKVISSLLPSSIFDKI